MNISPNPIYLALKLGAIISLSEVVVMVILNYFDIIALNWGSLSTLLDPLLLFVVSIVPYYLIVHAPLIKSFNDRIQENHMLSAALSDAGSSIIITDKDARILYVNKAFTETTGYSYSESIGNNPNMLSSSNQPKEFYEKMWGSILISGSWSGEVLNKKKNGELFYESLSIRKVLNKDNTTKYFVGVFSDITEKKKMEDAIIDSQRDELIGTLISGVAHNFNNILTAISGKAYLIRKKISEEKSRAHLKDIQNLSTESSNLIDSLLSFAGKHQHKNDFFNLSDSIASVYQSSRLIFSRNISIISDISERTAICYGDKTLVEQALMNVISNAINSLTNTADKTITMSFHVSDEFGVVEISDNGSGINSADLDYIFNPFFTTSENGDKGLGLSVCKGILTNIGGSIDVVSVIGTGSSFTIRIPLSEEDGETPIINDC